MFRTDLLSIIKRLNNVYAAIGFYHTENSVLYNTEFYLQNVLKSNEDLHVRTAVNLLNIKISVRQIPIAVNTVSRLLMMGSKPVRNM
jgi:hypothetical protein